MGLFMIVLIPAIIKAPPAIYLKYPPKCPKVNIEKNTSDIPPSINIGTSSPVLRLSSAIYSRNNPTAGAIINPGHNIPHRFKSSEKKHVAVIVKRTPIGTSKPGLLSPNR
jgi:hypothetical protein